MPPAWTESIPELQGELVVVREFAPGDAATLYEMLGDPRVAEYMTAPPGSVEAFEGFSAWARRERELGQGVCFAIVPPGLTEAVGIIQLRANDPSWFTAQWGFAIGHGFWATGAFYDAAQLVVSFAFEQMNVHRLEARSMVNNGRGNGALQKIGAKPEGALASAFAKDGRYNAQFLWALHRDRWSKRTVPRPRFSVAEAKASIAAATKRTARLLSRQRTKHRLKRVPRPYPFFISET
jgi:ribosomal-protein-alanine N-acetyltransferase